MIEDTEQPIDKKADSLFEDSSYIDHIYDEARKPKSHYPAQLAAHLRDSWYKNTGSLLDVGCGRGDMLSALFDAGYSVAGVDLSPTSIESCKPHPIKIANLETEPFPYGDESFDYIFSKSVIEHLNQPLPFLKQTLRVLKPEGNAIIMTPSWIHNQWGPFYIDFTHVRPFTKPSLRDAMQMAGFKNVRVSHFRQLPFLWRHPWMTPAIQLLAQLPLRYQPMHEIKLPVKLNTLFRFSKEVMLIGIGNK